MPAAAALCGRSDHHVQQRTDDAGAIPEAGCNRGIRRWLEMILAFMPAQPGFRCHEGPPLATMLATTPNAAVAALASTSMQPAKLATQPGALDALGAPAAPIEPRSPRWQWMIAKDLARPGFMTLRAVRQRGLIVDFVWDSACPVASRLLNQTGQDLRGRSLLRALAKEPCCATAFARYRCVVQTGSAQAIRHPAQVNGHVDICRHGAVPWHDGVAVTLTNLSAIQQVQALRSLARASNASNATPNH